MRIIHVDVAVKPGQEVAFLQATLENARNSLEEPGVIRFDILQQQADPTRFTLVEIYRTEQDPARHKETAHYQKWRDRVADMMARPRSSVHYRACFPEPERW